MLGFPVKSDETRNQQLSTITAGSRLSHGLMQEQRVAHRAIDSTVEDVGKCFALCGCQYSIQVGGAMRVKYSQQGFLIS